VVLFDPSSIAADLETVERLEATARRDDPRGAAICAEARRGYRALAAQAGRGGALGIRLALLSDVARLGETNTDGTPPPPPRPPRAPRPPCPVWREVDFVTAGRKILLASALHVLDDD
jgi:hypothetical protein